MGYLALSRSNEQSLPESSIYFYFHKPKSKPKVEKNRILIALRTNLCWNQLLNMNNATKNVVCFATAELHNSNFFLYTGKQQSTKFLSFPLASISMHFIHFAWIQTILSSCVLSFVLDQLNMNLRTPQINPSNVDFIQTKTMAINLWMT